MNKFEKEIGKIKWGKNHELVFRYAEFVKKKGKELRKGIDIRLYKISPKYTGWTTVGLWIQENEMENFAAIFQEALKFYKAQQVLDSKSNTTR